MSGCVLLHCRHVVVTCRSHARDAGQKHAKLGLLPSYSSAWSFSFINLKLNVCGLLHHETTSNSANFPAVTLSRLFSLILDRQDTLSNIMIDFRFSEDAELQKLSDQVVRVPSKYC